MEVFTSTQKVPYEAKVRITYEDGTSRVVTDKGTWKGVYVMRFKSKVGKAYNLTSSKLEEK